MKPKRKYHLKLNKRSQEGKKEVSAEKAKSTTAVSIRQQTS